MGNCFSKSKKGKAEKTKSDSLAKEQPGALEIRFNTSPIQGRSAQKEIPSPAKILLSEEELNHYPRTLTTEIILKDSQVIEQINSSNPLRHVSESVVKFTKDSQLIATGMCLLDQFVITSSQNLLALKQEPVFFKSSAEVTPFVPESSYESQQFVIFKTPLPLSFTTGKATLKYIEEPPSYTEPLNVLHYSSASPHLRQDTVFIKNQDCNTLELSKSFSEHSLGGPIFDLKNRLVGILISSNKALSFLHIRDIVTSLQTTDSPYLEKLISSWKHLVKHEILNDCSYIKETRHSNVSSNYSKPRFPSDIHQVPPSITKKFKEIKPNTKTKKINRVIANSLGMTNPNNFIESCFYIKDSKLVSYNARTSRTSQTSISEVPTGHSITQSQIGVFILYENQCLLWNETSTIEVKSPSSRYINHSALLVKHKLLAIGGKHSKTVEFLDLKSLEWEEGPTLPHKIQHGSAICVYGRVYLLGGVKHGRTTDKILMLGDEWEILSIKLPIGLAGMGTIVVQDCFYIIGGFNENGYNKNTWRQSIEEENYELLEEFFLESAYGGRQFARSENQFVGFSGNGKLVKFNTLTENLQLLKLDGFDFSEEEDYLSLLNHS